MVMVMEQVNFQGTGARARAKPVSTETLSQEKKRIIESWIENNSLNARSKSFSSVPVITSDAETPKFVSTRSRRIMENLQQSISTPLHGALSKQSHQNVTRQPVVILTREKLQRKSIPVCSESDSLQETLSEPFSRDSLTDPEFVPEDESDDVSDDFHVDNTAKQQSVSTATERDRVTSTNTTISPLTAAPTCLRLPKVTDEGTAASASTLPDSNITVALPTTTRPNDNIITVDHRSKIVQSSRSGSKKYFCIYCKKEICNFGRHLLTVHKNEASVKSILDFPKGHPVREKEISKIRHAGALEFNTLDNNTTTIHVIRRPTNEKKSADHYKACPYCQQMYAKVSIRVHTKKCKNRVSEMLNSTKNKTTLMNIHPDASKRLIQVMSQSRDDGVLSAVSFDKLAITYGNKLIIKYRNERNNAMIRHKIRSVGLFIRTFQKLNSNYNNLKDILDPGNYNTIVKTINTIAGLDAISGKYSAPSTAYNLGLQLKELAMLLETECIKEKNQIMRDNVRDLISLMTNGFSTDVNKTVIENQTEQSRQKTIKLPTKEDIQALKTFLQKKRTEAYNNLVQSFSTKSWKDLAGMTLISIQLFNRRRAGELERILIEDYKTATFVSDEDEVFKGLPASQRTIAKKYARFYIRGKLNRSVSVILNQDIINCIELFLKHRTEYGVDTKNPYVFGIPSKSNLSYLRACQLMRHYSTMCGAPNPETLRGTELRKQIATACSVYQLADPLVEDIANHLGHHMNIHKQIYRQSLAREVPAVTQILLRALGEEDSNQEEVDDVEYRPQKETVHSCGLVNNDLEGMDTAHNIESNYIATTQNEQDDTLQNLERNDTTHLEVDITEQHNSSVSNANERRSSGSNKRNSWTPQERHVVVNAFQHMIDNGIVPTYQECVELKSTNHCLENRTPPQIKSFVAYATKRSAKTSFKRVTWIAPEIAVVQREFKDYLDNKTLPSLKFCENVIEKNAELNSRTAVTLKAYVNNLNRKK